MELAHQVGQRRLKKGLRAGVGLLIPFLLARCAAGSSMEILAATSVTDAEGLAGLALRVDGRTFSARSFEGTNRVSLTVPDSGELHFHMLLTQGGDVVSEGSFTVRMYPDSGWTIEIYRQADDPTLPFCFGCGVKESFPVAQEWANEPGERIWFIGGGLPKDGSIVT
jgi:hypothetical protein